MWIDRRFLLDLTVAVDMTAAAAYVRMSYECTIIWLKSGQVSKRTTATNVVPFPVLNDDDI